MDSFYLLDTGPSWLARGGGTHRSGDNRPNVRS